MKNKMNYQSAYDELQKILQALQEGNLPLEELTSQVKQAHSLVKVCREKLRNAEIEMDAVMKDLQSE